MTDKLERRLASQREALAAAQAAVARLQVEVATLREYLEDARKGRDAVMGVLADMHAHNWKETVIALAERIAAHTCHVAERRAE